MQAIITKPAWVLKMTLLTGIKYVWDVTFDIYNFIGWSDEEWMLKEAGVLWTLEMVLYQANEEQTK